MILLKRNIAPATKHAISELERFVAWLDSRDLAICEWRATEYRPYRSARRVLDEFHGRVGALDAPDWQGPQACVESPHEATQILYGNRHAKVRVKI